MNLTTLLLLSGADKEVVLLGFSSSVGSAKGLLIVLLAVDGLLDIVIRLDIHYHAIRFSLSEPLKSFHSPNIRDSTVVSTSQRESHDRAAKPSRLFTDC